MTAPCSVQAQVIKRSSDNMFMPFSSQDLYVFELTKGAFYNTPLIVMEK
jgi:predicted transposase YdaD